MSMRWAPIADARRAAKVSRGMYRCSVCSKVVPSSIPTPPGHKSKKKRINNVIVDHTLPIIDPAIGFVSWDLVIAAMFCEVENLQVMCRSCSDVKTTGEREIATARRTKEKQHAH